MSVRAEMANDRFSVRISRLPPRLSVRRHGMVGTMNMLAVEATMFASILYIGLS